MQITQPLIKIYQNTRILATFCHSATGPGCRTAKKGLLRAAKTKGAKKGSQRVGGGRSKKGQRNVQRQTHATS